MFKTKHPVGDQGYNCLAICVASSQAHGTDLTDCLRLLSATINKSPNYIRSTL